MDVNDKIERLAQLPPETLAKELVRIANEADALSRTQRLHFNYMPDEATKSLYQHAPYFIPRDDLAYNGNSDDLTHRLIIGDNIHAIMGLQLEEGTYDLAYSDPPYNTGSQDFIYNDRFVPADDSWTHSKWLSFMEPRLKLERNLLKETGIKIVAIGNRELANMRTLMDSIYGEENFIDMIVWEGGPKNDSRFVSNGSDYMLIYAKNKSVLLEQDIKWREEKSGVHEVLAAGAKAWEDSGHDAEEATKLLKKWWRGIPADHPAFITKSLKSYNMINTRGEVYRYVPLDFPNGGGPTYDVIHPITGKSVKVPSRGWVAVESTMKDWIEKGEVIFGKDESTIPNRMATLARLNEMVPSSHFFSHRRAGNNHVASILGKKVFDFPKDHTVLARWFNIVAGKDAKVIDCFAGSGSTMEAVLSLNAQDGGTRTCTLVTNDENGIGTNITRERCVRVMTGENWADGKEHEGLGGNLAVFEIGLHDTRVGVKNFLDPRLSEVKRMKWVEKAGPLMGFAYGCNWLVEEADGIMVFTDNIESPTKHCIVVTDIFVATQENFLNLADKYENAVMVGVESCQSQKNTYLGAADVQMPAPQIGTFRRNLINLHTDHFGNFADKVETLANSVTIDNEGNN